ncbi:MULTISPECIES: hypothetical protein [Hoyosella]|uniref:Uncharacterized protein n=2 Tax=Hoyosella TaxID=697025 RepID=F6EKA5_HOYSD|nr:MULTISPECIES: hypothetical protein [Hoyosella]AEF42646.1 hypothetical protein AS9A_4213 [Hoyosella subflava DQS3-9A1]MBB3039460.1 hypothetical protein [Hoyosella altamirensis]
MAEYRIINSSKEVVESTKLHDATEAVEWFRNNLPNGADAYRLEVQTDQGDWEMLDETEST